MNHDLPSFPNSRRPSVTTHLTRLDFFKRSQPTPILLLLLIAFSSQATAQPPLLNPAPTSTELSIEEAAQKASAGNWVDALEQYQRILDTNPDDLVPVNPSRASLLCLAEVSGPCCWMVSRERNEWIPARWLCHLHLSQMPANVLKIYRDRIDSQALKRFQEAEPQWDDRKLEALLADFFCSSASEEAIRLLADRAFERADFERAQYYWSLLHPLWDAAPWTAKTLRYPEPAGDPAAIRARLILIKLFREDGTGAKRQFEIFRKQYPDSKGLLAGRDGNYSETLGQLLEGGKRSKFSLPEAESKCWSSFANGPTRNSYVSGQLFYYWPDSPTWHAKIPSHRILPKIGSDDLPSPADHPRGLAFQPVIVHGKAFICDATTIYAYDLMTGHRSVVFDLRKTVAIPGLDGRLPVRTPLRYSLTWANDHLYARLGTQNIHPGQDEAAEDGPERNYSCVVCLGPLESGKDEAPALRWILEPPTSAKDSVSIFEGTPVVSGDRLYSLVTRPSGGDNVSTVVCYQNPDRREKPEIIWQRDVRKLASLPSQDNSATQQLLTLAEGRILFSNNAGSILALDAHSGKIAWAYQYRRQERQLAPSILELCPCLAAGGQVFAAPTDAHSIFCLDINTGRLLWEHEGVEGTQFLGVTHDLLICSVRGSVKGLRAVDDKGNAIWSHHDDGGESTFGTGLVTADLILWPTRHGLQFLQPSTGGPLRQPITGSLGNLCYADGFLIVTTPTEIWCYVAERHFLGDRRREVGMHPTDGRLQIQLAMAEADAGQYEDAKQRLQRCARGTSVASEANRRRRELIMDQLQQALHDGRIAAIADIRRDSDVARDQEMDVTSRLAESALALTSKDQQNAKQLLHDLVKLPGAARFAIRDDSGALRRIDSIAMDWLEKLGEKRTGSKHLQRVALSLPTAPAWENSLLRSKNVGQSIPNLFPLTGMSGHSISTIYTATGRSIYRFDSVNQEMVPFGTTPFDPEFAELHGGSVILAGAGGIVSLRADDGQTLWQFIPSSALSLVSVGFVDENKTALSFDWPASAPRSTREPANPPQLSAFRIAGEKIVCLVDRREFVQLDLSSGNPVWKRLPGEPEELGTKYYPFFRATSKYLVAQCASGKMQISCEGSVLLSIPTGPQSWIQDPILVNQDEVIVATDPETIICINLASQTTVWKNSMSLASSASGDLPQLRLHGKSLLVKWSRNHGQELDSLDANTGVSRWKDQPFFLDSSDLDLAGIDDECIYLVQNGTLLGIALDTGKLNSRFAIAGLDRGGWQVHISKSSLLLHPNKALQKSRQAHYDIGEDFGDLNLNRLVISGMDRYEGWMNRTLPILMVDRFQGNILQRFSLPVRGPTASVALGKHGCLAVAGEAAYWLSPLANP